MKDYNKSIEVALQDASVDSSLGLTNGEAKERINKYGNNELEAKKEKSLFFMFIEKLKELNNAILLGISLLMLFQHHYTDMSVVLFMVIVNITMALNQELKAKKSNEAMKNLSSPTCLVLRDGKKIEIDSRSVTIGDIIFIEAGDKISADGRIIRASNLMIQEATLTGEAVPVNKNTNIIKGDDIIVGDRTNMVFAGTTVTFGTGVFLVTQVGMNTEIGSIAKQIAEIEEPSTPLQVKLDEIGKFLMGAVVIISILTFVIGIKQSREIVDMMYTSISLAVAAMPEGLPAIVTIVLSIGVQRLSKKNAVIKKLPAVETLGSASVICSDKTGTLTQNKMTVVSMWTDIEKEPNYVVPTKQDEILITGMTLCTDAEIQGEKEIGDPTEVALVRFGQVFNKNKAELLGTLPRVADLSFDSDRMMMSTIHKTNDGYRVFTKGATDKILTRCTGYLMPDGSVRPMQFSDKKEIVKRNESYAKNAKRVLALTYKDVKSYPDKLNSSNLEYDLVFVGLVGMIDPPREEVKLAIEKCRLAGIKPVMITGDHPTTAVAIARELGMYDIDSKFMTGKELEKISQDELNKIVTDYSVYARVSPEHKVKIVKAWKNQERVVAMTGDGVNDAPALSEADIGVAMGITGTDVAKDSADMILMDDNFATIVSAVEEGRGIFDNIKRSIRYLLSCNMGEVFLILSGIVMGTPTPLIPIQILFINLVTDSFPALALGVEPADEDIMTQKPRPKKEGIFTKEFTINVMIEGFIVGIVSFALFKYGLQFGETVARTMAFLSIALLQLIHSINLRSEQSIFKKGLTTNKSSLYAVLTSTIIQLLVVYVPFLQSIFGTTTLNVNQLLLVVLSSFSIMVIVEFKKLLKK